MKLLILNDMLVYGKVGDLTGAVTNDQTLVAVGDFIEAKDKGNGNTRTYRGIVVEDSYKCGVYGIFGYGFELAKLEVIRIISSHEELQHNDKVAATMVVFDTKPAGVRPSEFDNFRLEVLVLELIFRLNYPNVKGDSNASINSPEYIAYLIDLYKRSTFLPNRQVIQFVTTIHNGLTTLGLVNKLDL